MLYRKKLWFAIIIILAITPLIPRLVQPVKAAPVWTVSLDANSTSATDILTTPSYAPNATFKVGATVNATAANPISNIAGWQFAINYNSTLVIPQADPDPKSLYPDGAGNLVTLGNQTTFGTVSWVNAKNSGAAFSLFRLTQPGQIYVFFAYFVGNGPATLSAKTLLASVSFELLNKSVTPQAFSISDVVFSDPNSQPLPGVTAAPPPNPAATPPQLCAAPSFAYCGQVTEKVLNDPPRAQITLTKLSTYVLLADGTASSDGDGTIADPGGYYWDWGDGTHNFTSSSVILAHDYSSICATGCPNGMTLPAVFNVTLRVVDNKGSTGSARDALGSVIVNAQPSHTWKSFTADIPPTGTVSYTQITPAPNGNVAFTATASDSDGTVASTLWNFGDGTPRVSGNTTTISHTYSASGTYTAILTLTDNLGAATNVTKIVMVVAAQNPTLTVTAPSTGTAGTTVTITLSSSSPNPSGSITSMKIDWGDGIVDTVNGGSGTPTHTYSQAGTYTVTVTSTDNTGGTTMKQATIVVAAAPGLSSSLLLVLIAVPVVAIVVGALLFLRRRKKATTPASPPKA